MEDIKIQQEINEVLTELEKIYKDVEQARTDANSLCDKIQKSSWTGAAKDKCVDITVLTSQYHDDILFLIESLKQHIQVMCTDIQEFPGISVRMRELGGGL